MILHDQLTSILIGCGATLVMDVWLLLLKKFGIQTLNFAFVGRWFGHLFHGHFMHTSIAKAEPIRNELLLGWIVHYVIGIFFAGLLVGFEGSSWMRNPTCAPAMVVGVGTVIARSSSCNPLWAWALPVRKLQHLGKADSEALRTTPFLVRDCISLPC